MTVSGGLLERDGVTKAVAGLVEAVRGGQGGALFVVGEAGLGKTAVLGRGRDLAAAAGLRVGFGRGHPMESAVPFGVLIQGLDGAGGRGLLREDEPGFARGDDRAARFFGVLRWLERRDGAPVVLVVDDLHWADADSLALAVFLCRRMSLLRAGLLASLRPWPAAALEAAAGLAQEGCARIERLAPLTVAGAAALLEAQIGRPVPVAVRRRAFKLCAGNPLLLEQVAVAIGRGETVPDAAHAGRGAVGEGLLLARFAGLPVAGMRCARAAAVLGTRFVPEVAAQVAGLHGTEIDAALESLGHCGLIEQGPGPDATFIHPLFRQALYDDLGAAARARLHARAFAAFVARGMDAVAAEHAVRANLAGDAEAVAVLERAGRAARRAGALATAVGWLDAAVAMAGDRASISLLLAQAEAWLASGGVARAVAAYQRLVGTATVSLSARTEALWMLGRALAMTGDHDSSAAAFDQAAALARDGDQATAVEVLLDAAFCCWLSAGSAAALSLASRARGLARPLGPELRTRADATWGELAVLCGDPAGMAAAEAAAPWRAPGQRTGPGNTATGAGGGWGPNNSFAYCACLMERFAEADRAFTAARAAAEQASAPEGVATLAVGHSYTLTRMGRFDEALTAINVAVALLDLVPLMEAYAAVGRAYIQLYRGDLDDSAHWVQRAEATALARGELNAQLFAWDVLGHRRLRDGAAAEACEYYTRLEATVDRMGIGEPCLPPWSRHAISAYLAAGRTGDAERVLAWVDDAAQRLPCRFPKIVVVTGRARLAEVGGDRDAAHHHFSDALALHKQVDLPVEHAETLLDYGAFLRRYGQPAQARRALAQAIQVAEDAQAGWLAGLAHAELRVAGGRRRQPSAASGLTAQESRVAALAATGASNPQIARQLSVSVRTIETHLERIYAKLGVRSRHELIANAAARGQQPAARG